MHKAIDKTSFFGQGRRVVVASAPGRLDVMGGVADYSGTLLLQMPIKEQATVWMAKRNDGQFNIHTVTNAPPNKLHTPLSLSLNLKEEHETASGIELLIRQLKEKDNTTWALYLLGGLWLLAREKQVNIRGADIWLESQVPVGKGVSSSAAIEVATLSAAAMLFNSTLGRLELPLMAQKVENNVVGAACGLMDQLATWLGKREHLLPIVCQPVETFEPVKIADGAHFIGLDSGVQHAVSGDAYTKVRVGAFMGYTIIAHLMGASPQDILQAKQANNGGNLPYQGYLANIPLHAYQAKFEEHLPLQLTGDEFLRQHQSIWDSVAAIDPSTTYPIKYATEHPIYEQERIALFKKQIDSPTLDYGTLTELGRLMYASHHGYTKCGLGHERTDEMVELVKAAGADKGVFGARITGGGNGGTVCILAYGDKGLQTVKDIRQSLSAKYGQVMNIFESSGDGGAYSPKSWTTF